MKDNQWPRFMVFQKEREGEPWKHNGSVHAPDIELALLNARDVFLRRPDAAEIWVVPAERILSKTREELQNTDWAATPQPSNNREDQISTHYVFGKLSEQAQGVFLREVEADSPQTALQQAHTEFDDRTVLRWWVFRKADILASGPQDADPMFAPARDKTYKSSREYPVVTMMRQIRTKGKLED